MLSYVLDKFFAHADAKWPAWERGGSRTCRRREIDTGGREYLIRYYVWPWLFLHRYMGGDGERWLHDHPFRAISFILRGWYIEERMRWIAGGVIKTQLRMVCWFNHLWLRSVHRVAQIKPGTVSLFIVGPRQKEWGFYEQKWDEVAQKFYVKTWQPYGSTEEG